MTDCTGATIIGATHVRYIGDDEVIYFDSFDHARAFAAKWGGTPTQSQRPETLGAWYVRYNT